MNILEGQKTIISGRNQKIEINKIKVGTRLRKIDQSKVNDLVESIQLIGLLQPIVVDSDNNLLAGNHRLEAHRVLGETTIECKRVSLSELRFATNSNNTKSRSKGMEKSLLQNRINPKVKEKFHRYSQLVGIPMNKLVEGFIEDGIK